VTGPAVATTRVLVVEDNDVDAKLVRFALQGVAEWRLTLERVADGEQAIHYLEKKGAYLERNRPDLVVLDLNLPKCDGIEVLRRIRHDPQLKNLRVIVLSSSPRDAIEERVRDAEVQPDCYFTKPVGLDEFLALGATMHRCYLYGGVHQQTPRRAGA
jgi:chemotaxis family two-component system response regulator Rcp1